ncbi:hypothetical protein SB822_57030, partial [Paraburkholderia sp. SIMBA_054]
YDFAYQAWIGDYNDTYSFLSMFTTDNYFNNSDWSNKDYDALIIRSETMTTPERGLKPLLRQSVFC